MTGRFDFLLSVARGALKIKESHHGAVNLKLPTGTVTLTMPTFPTDPKTFSALSESCLLEIWSARKLDLVSIFLGIG